MSVSQFHAKRVKVEEEELQHLTGKHSCVTQLQRARQRTSETAFTAAVVERPGDWRSLSAALLDPSSAVHEGQSLCHYSMHSPAALEQPTVPRVPHPVLHRRVEL